MTVEYTFEVASEQEALDKCAVAGLTLVRVSPLPAIKEHRHEANGRFYALAIKDTAEVQGKKLMLADSQAPEWLGEAREHVPHDSGPEKLLAPPRQCPGVGCGVLIEGQEPHAKDCSWWKAEMEGMANG